MESEKRRKEDANFFIKYWEIIAFAIGVIFLSGGFYFSLQSITARVCATETKCEKIPVFESQYNSIDKRLERIENKLDNLG